MAVSIAGAVILLFGVLIARRVGREDSSRSGAQQWVINFGVGISAIIIVMLIIS